MNSDGLREWLEIVGILAVVASLVFVGIEVRQSSEAATDQGLASDLANMLAVEELVTSNSGVWLRGCNGEELNAEDQLVFTRIYHSYEFLYFVRWLRGQRGVHVESENLGIDNMAMNLYRYPGISNEWRRHWESRVHVSDEVLLHKWRDLVEKRVAEYPSFEPEPIADPSRCGLI